MHGVICERSFACQCESPLSLVALLSSGFGRCDGAPTASSTKSESPHPQAGVVPTCQYMMFPVYHFHGWRRCCCAAAFAGNTGPAAVAIASPNPLVSKAPPGSVECGNVDDGKGGVLRLSCSGNQCCSQYGSYRCKPRSSQFC
jgi:hypothetical protein